MVTLRDWITPFIVVAIFVLLVVVLSYNECSPRIMRYNTPGNPYRLRDFPLFSELFSCDCIYIPMR